MFHVYESERRRKKKNGQLASQQQKVVIIKSVRFSYLSESENLVDSLYVECALLHTIRHDTTWYVIRSESARLRSVDSPYGVGATKCENNVPVRYIRATICVLHDAGWWSLDHFKRNFVIAPPSLLGVQPHWHWLTITWVAVASVELTDANDWAKCY